MLTSIEHDVLKVTRRLAPDIVLTAAKVFQSKGTVNLHDALSAIIIWCMKGNGKIDLNSSLAKSMNFIINLS